MDNNWPEFDAIILDMDGLVIDSEPTYRHAWKTAALSLGYTLPGEILESFTGRTFESIQADLIRHLGDQFPISRFREKSAELWYAYINIHSIKAKPGIGTLLKTMNDHHIPFCLATNSQKIHAQHCLAQAGLSEEFKSMVTREQVERPKPAPDIFLAAARKLNTAPKKCLVVEDSAPGIRAAALAGTIPLLVPGHSTLPLPEHPDAFIVVESLYDINKIVISSRASSGSKYPSA